jgi:hypothetical protein
MRQIVTIFCRAFSQVVLVAGNTVQLAAYQRTHDPMTLVSAGLVGGLISWVWWANSRATVKSDHPGARLAYALGATAGTLVGAALIATWYR